VNSKKIALYGGAFDPPHIGHKEFIEVLEKVDFIDEVWIVPSGRRPDKVYTISDAERQRLIKLFLKDIRSSEVKKRVLIPLELDTSATASPIIGTVELIKRLKELYPNNQFYFCIGSDLMCELPKWRHQEQLKNEVLFLVLERKGESSQKNCKEEKAMIAVNYQVQIIQDIKITEVSSSELRELLSSNLKNGQKKDIKKEAVTLLTPSVLQYIIKHCLYQNR
jgi:nicotinate-nucleotide adenylyltransferase